MENDLFIITSVINTGVQPWSYSGTRSPFSVLERFNQTLQSIESIRKLNDNTKIILIECSDINEEMTNTLKNNVDYFIQTHENSAVRDACINSNKKGYGETMKVQIACEFIKSHNIKFNRLFKLSGRYFLTNSFSKDNYSTTNFTFKLYNAESGSTVLYSVPYVLFDIYIENIILCNLHYTCNPPTGLETLLPIISEPKYNIPLLGVSGYVSAYNNNGETELYIA